MTSSALPNAVPRSSLVTLVHGVYALHALSVLMGASSAALVVTAFIFSVPSFVAVAINYLKRSEAEGTWLASHFRWQINTFWAAAGSFALGVALFMTVLGIPLAFLVWTVAALWVGYRVVKGWLALRDGRPVS